MSALMDTLVDTFGSQGGRRTSVGAIRHSFLGWQKYLTPEMRLDRQHLQGQYW